jgi:hypothetical protein
VRLSVPLSQLHDVLIASETKTLHPEAYLAANVSLPSFESFRITNQRAKLKVHQPYAEGTGGKTEALLSLAKKHRKVIIFTNPSLVRWTADVFCTRELRLGPTLTIFLRRL